MVNTPEFRWFSRPTNGLAAVLFPEAIKFNLPVIFSSGRFLQGRKLHYISRQTISGVIYSWQF